MIVALPVIAILIGQPALPADLCRTASAAVAGRSCHRTGYGVVLAADAGEARRLGALLEQGEQRFIRHFRRPPGRYAVIQSSTPEQQNALRGAGFERVLPWLAPAQLESATIASVRRGVEAQAAARGLGAEQARAAADTAEQTWRERNPASKRLEQEAGVVPHEAGHLWFIEAFWPDAATDGRGHYGGPGPDWIDETAAILMESDGFAADRRRQFEQVYRGTMTTGPLTGLDPAEIIDLKRFLTRDHPGKALQGSGGAVLTGEQARELARSGGVRVMSGGEARTVARGGAPFYLQGRMFADFLIERSGDPAIFASLGEGFGRGLRIDQWLAAEAERYRLPTTLDELDRTWREWLAQRFGPPASGSQGARG